MLVAFMRVLESADGAGIHCADPAQEAQVTLAALQAFAQRKARNGMNALSYTAEHIHKGLTLLCDIKQFYIYFVVEPITRVEMWAR